MTKIIIDERRERDELARVDVREVAVLLLA